MAYVAPNSDIVFFRDIKLSSDYTDTIYFSSTSAQESYFFSNSKILSHLTHYSYTRTRRNTIKVKLPVSTIEQSTYMAFKNTSYENKWFYCFVDDFNYINDNTTEVVYTIDVIQTYFISQCSLQQCMVVREHAMDDTVGANRIPEPIGSDHFKYTLKWEDNWANYNVIITATATETTGFTGDFFQQGMFNGMKMYKMPLSDGGDADDIMAMLKDMLGDGNYIDPEQGTDRQQVVSIIMFPEKYVGENITTGLPSEYTAGFVINRTNVDGYVPKNNKLFTAPFKCLFLTNTNGGGVTLDYDDFDVDTASFKTWGVCSGSGEVVCVPLSYKGVQTNLDFKLVISGFPQCAYTLDAYRAWVAGGGQKYQKMGVVEGIANGLFKAIGTAQLGNMLGQDTENAYEDAAQTIYAGAPIQKTVDAYTNTERVAQNVYNRTVSNMSGIGGTIFGTAKKYLQTKYETGNMINVPVGNSTACATVANRSMGFKCYELNIIAQDAQRIDDFFSMYGYATNKIKVPNINGRPQWNFVQTENCVVTGNVPSAIRTYIANLFDAGIRFWNNGDNIGNYSLTNK